MRVFITGGTGSVGRHIIPRLLLSGHVVRALARSDQATQKAVELGAVPVRGDYHDLALLEAEAEKVDIAIHAAFDHGVPNVMEEAAHEGPAITALARGLASNVSENKILFACSSIGMARSDDPVTTELDDIPWGFRHSAGSALEATAGLPGLKVCTIRLPMITHMAEAPHPFLDLLQGLGKEHGAVPYPRDGTTRWAAGAVTDVAELVRLACDQTDKLVLGRVNNLHPFAELIPTKELAETVARQYGWNTVSWSDDKLAQLPPFPQLVLTRDPNVSNEWSKETFGWSPTGKSLWEDAKEGQYWGKAW